MLSSMVHLLAITPISCGLTAILLGAIPGLLDGIVNAITGASESVQSAFFFTQRSPAKNLASSQAQRNCFMGLGLLFLIASLLASL